jgi:hypothetical protein
MHIQGNAVLGGQKTGILVWRASSMDPMCIPDFCLELGASAADMAQQLVQPNPLHTIIIVKCTYLRRVGKGNGLRIRHLVQVPLKRTLPARHLHTMCCHYVPKHLALLRAFENTSALKVRIGQFSKLCELDYWNGTVLNVAPGLILVCMEFMHVRLQRSELCPQHCVQEDTSP